MIFHKFPQGKIEGLDRFMRVIPGLCVRNSRLAKCRRRNGCLPELQPYVDDDSEGMVIFLKK